ncbi:X4-like protein [Rhinolophus bat coronavirus HKU32]|nr:X4-like protein [Rhinolophus bat coronavirus HKU32]QCX35187.1 X4-like protein [Rhinolophus bat coronavirus HKU32]
MRILILFSILALVASVDIVHYIDCIAGSTTTFGQPCEGTIESTSPIQFVRDHQYGRIAVSCLQTYVHKIRIVCPHGNHTFVVRSTTYRTNVRYTQPQGSEVQMLILSLLIVIVLYLCLRR